MASPVYETDTHRAHMERLDLGKSMLAACVMQMRAEDMTWTEIVILLEDAAAEIRRPEKRAKRERSRGAGGEWDNPDHYVVQSEGQTVGRIFMADAAHPEGRPWMWTVEFHQRQVRPGPHQGYTADLESAMRALRESWDVGV
jgi:hypothetical protein